MTSVLLRATSALSVIAINDGDNDSCNRCTYLDRRRELDDDRPVLPPPDGQAVQRLQHEDLPGLDRVSTRPGRTTDKLCTSANGANGRIRLASNI